MSSGWSAGDIASALNLLIKVGKAVKEACEDSTQYEEIHSFLSTLQTILQHIQALDSAFIRSSQLGELREQCRLLRLPITKFLSHVEKFEPSLAAGNKRHKLLSAPRRIRWALEMPTKIKQLQERIQAPMLNVGLIMGFHTVETIARLEQAMPSTLKEQMSLVLEEQLPRHLESGLQPLSTTLTICSERITASQVASNSSLVRRINDANKSICDALESQKNSYNTGTETIEQQLKDMKLEVQSVPTRISEIVSEQHKDALKAESRLFSAVSSCHDQLRSVRQSLDAQAILQTQLEQSLVTGGDQDLRLAIQALGKHLRICLWLFISAVQKLIRDLSLLLMPFLVTLSQTLARGSRRLLLPLMGDSFLFEDALGRKRYLPCHSHQHWEVFYSYLESSFQDSPGLQYIITESFALMNGYNDVMIQPNMWQALIQPGGKVKMAIVAHYGIIGGRSSCPVWKCEGKVLFSSENQRGNCSICQKEVTLVKSLEPEVFNLSPPRRSPKTLIRVEKDLSTAAENQDFSMVDKYLSDAQDELREISRRDLFARDSELGPFKRIIAKPTRIKWLGTDSVKVKQKRGYFKTD